MRWLITAVFTFVALLSATTHAPAARRQGTSPVVEAGAYTEVAAELSRSSVEVFELAGDLGEIIGKPGWEQSTYGVLVVSLERGDTLFAMNPDLGLAPASNLKLYSTAAALYYL